MQHAFFAMRVRLGIAHVDTAHGSVHVISDNRKSERIIEWRRRDCKKKSKAERRSCARCVSGKMAESNLDLRNDSRVRFFYICDLQKPFLSSCRMLWLDYRDAWKIVLKFVEEAKLLENIFCRSNLKYSQNYHV